MTASEPARQGPFNLNQDRGNLSDLEGRFLDIETSGAYLAGDHDYVPMEFNPDDLQWLHSPKPGGRLAVRGVMTGVFERKIRGSKVRFAHIAYASAEGKDRAGKPLIALGEVSLLLPPGFITRVTVLDSPGRQAAA